MHPRHPPGFGRLVVPYEMTSLNSLDGNLARTNSSVSGSQSTSPLLDSSPFSNSTPKVTEGLSHRYQTSWQKRRSWRFAIMLGLLGVSFTFVVNLALTIWASTKGFEKGIATLQEGDCNMTKKLDLWLHLGINLLSTLLLGASNYTMQCLSSPTRDEIDKAHQQRVFLDIGIPSVRNLRRISWRRRILWWFLALSSIPLHLMYNSAVFSTLSTNAYTAAVVSHDFLVGAPFNVSNSQGIPFYISTSTSNISSIDVSLLTLRNNQSKLQNLSSTDCRKAYQKDLTPDRLDVLAVSSATHPNNSLLSFWAHNAFDLSGGGHPYEWTCTQPGFIERCDFSTQNWTVLDAPIDYCLSNRTEPSCKLQLSLVIIVIVILCNISKFICMGLTIWKPSSIPLLTLGDVIASFLDQPDPNTENNCLASKYRFQGLNKSTCSNTLLRWISVFTKYGQDSKVMNDDLIDKNQHRYTGWDEAIRSSNPERYRWYHAPSLKRWLFCTSLCALTLVTAGVLLQIGLDNLSDRSISHLWSLGYGGISSETAISLEASSLISLILLANLPQTILSFLYLTYNAIFTSMLLSEEWSGFAHQRKTLRVTCPIGKQRSTYWLQLPYAYGLPLLVMSGILHWLVSQSIFLIRVVVKDPSRTGLAPDDYTGLYSTCGYSPIAIITVITLGALLLLVAIAIGFRKYKEGMPLAGSCSAAISAACHRPKDDVDAAVLPVIWGAVSTEGPIGHCCFTSFEVSTPVKGEPYADRDAMSSMDSGTTSGARSGQAGFELRSRN